MEIDMANTIPEQNKALVLQAFDTLFNKRDYEAAARFWSDTYIQHSDHIAPGREGLFDLIRSGFSVERSGTRPQCRARRAGPRYLGSSEIEPDRAVNHARRKAGARV
jgi:hypothetical protein